MAIQRYRRVLAVRAVRRALLVGLLVRTPIFAASIVLTLHVVGTLERGYAAAGLVSATLTTAIAISGPWRGRLLDRFGLRRTVLPSLGVELACWSIAPFTGYWTLLGLAAIAGLFAIPIFAVVRQSLIAAVSVEDRRAAISLDGSAVEVSFIVGPVLAVWAATTYSTAWVLFSVEMSYVAAGALLWIIDPALRRAPVTGAATAGAAQAPGSTPRSQWFRPRFIVICLTALATTIVLGGTDISIVAALRHLEQASSIGLVIALWGLGSLLGGLVYGALNRPIPSLLLLGSLAAVTAPMALSTGPRSLAVLAFVAGLLCAPVITATVDEVSRVVPEHTMGEAMGWHGSSMTIGMAIGVPLAGAAIDHAGFMAGFLLVAVVGLAATTAGAGALGLDARHRTRRRDRSSVAAPVETPAA